MTTPYIKKIKCSKHRALRNREQREKVEEKTSLRPDKALAEIKVLNL